MEVLDPCWLVLWEDASDAPLDASGRLAELDGREADASELPALLPPPLVVELKRRILAADAGAGAARVRGFKRSKVRRGALERPPNVHTSVDGGAAHLEGQV